MDISACRNACKYVKKWFSDDGWHIVCRKIYENVHNNISVNVF